MGDGINWEKVLEKPDKEYKAQGSYLLQQRKTIKEQEEKIEELNTTILNLKNEIEAMKGDLETRNNKIKEMATQTIPNLNKQITELKTVADEKAEIEREVAEIRDLVEDFKENEKLKDEILEEKNTKIEELMGGIKKHQDRVDELEKLIETLPTIDEMEGLNEHSKKLESEITELRAESEKLKKQIEETPKGPDISPEELEELQKRPPKKEMEALLADIDKYKGEIEEAGKVNEALKDKIADMHSEIEDLKSKATKPAPVEEAPRRPSTYTSAGVSGFGGFKKSGPSKIHPSRRKKVEVEGLSGPKPSSLQTPKGVLNPKVASLLETVREAINQGIVANQLARLLEDTRDEIAGIIGFKIVLNEIGNIARKLKKAPPDAQIADESQQIFLSKLDEWANRLR